MNAFAVPCLVLLRAQLFHGCAVFMQALVNEDNPDEPTDFAVGGVLGLAALLAAFFLFGLPKPIPSSPSEGRGWVLTHHPVNSTGWSRPVGALSCITAMKHGAGQLGFCSWSFVVNRGRPCSFASGWGQLKAAESATHGRLAVLQL